MKSIAIEAELSKILDLVLTFFSFSLAVNIYQMKKVLPEHLWPDYIVLLALYALLWILVSSTLLIYRSRRFFSTVSELTLLIKAHFITFSATLIAANLVNLGMIRNRFVFYFAVFSFLSMVAAHMFTRWFLEIWRKKGNNLRYVLILGSGRASELYLDKVHENPQIGYRVIGYLAAKKNGLNIPYLGNYDELEVAMRNLIVDLVVVTAPVSDPEVKKALDLVEIMGKNVAVLMDEMISRVANSRPIDFGGLPMVAFDNYPRRPWHEIGKRLFDIISSSAGILVLSPLLLIIALVIKLTSPGPVIFSQNRVGINGRIFKMYKFRSMVVNAESLKNKYAHLNEMNGPVFKIKNDPRVTPIGRFLRKTSLDEFPQLWNVFKGEMSIVGPRPPLPEEVNMYDPKHRKRLAVRPGITCIWQISGRNQVDFEEWMEMDTEYVDRWSLWLDMEILMKTVPVVLGRRGAS